MNVCAPRGAAAAAVLAAALAGMPLAGKAADPAQGLADAAAYPVHVISLVVPFAAGGPTDVMGRTLAAALGRELNGRVIVETIGGDGGARGSEQVARARPDGYTLLLHHAGHVAAPFVHRQLLYDPIKDFAPIGEVAEVPMTLVGRTDLPAGFTELKAWMRSRGSKVRLAHAGPGSASYLCGVRLAASIDAPMTAAAYKGTSRALDELQRGNVDLLCDQTLNTIEPIRMARVRAYLVTAAARVAALPEVPTAQEAGAEGLSFLIWYGLFAPAGTPPSVLAKLAAALQGAVRQPALRDALQSTGARVVDPAAATPGALRERMAADTQRWRTMPAGAGLPRQ